MALCYVIAADAVGEDALPPLFGLLAVVWATATIGGPILGGVLADFVLEPAARAGTGLPADFAWLVGTGPGSGMGLLIVICGLISALVVLMAIGLFLALPFVLSIGSVVFLPLVTWGGMAVKSRPPQKALVWGEGETLAAKEGWTEFTLVCNTRGTRLWLELPAGRAQFDWAEVVFENGEARVVDMREWVRGPGLFRLLALEGAHALEDDPRGLDALQAALVRALERREAAIEATKQITVAVLGATATLVFAFVPLLFLPGGPGMYIRSLPVAVISTILASLVVSLTIIPWLASLLLEDHGPAGGNRFLATWADSRFGPVDTFVTHILGGQSGR